MFGIKTVAATLTDAATKNWTTDWTSGPFAEDRLVLAAQVTLVGMLMVFAVLGILWAVLSVFKLVFVGKTPKAPKQEKRSVSKNTGAAGAQPSEDELIAILTAAVAAHQNNDEIIAVLTAAVSAYRAAEGVNTGFRVVAFKRAGSRSWNVK